MVGPAATQALRGFLGAESAQRSGQFCFVCLATGRAPGGVILRCRTA
jgi:hypothetical protein